MMPVDSYDWRDKLMKLSGFSADEIQEAAEPIESSPEKRKKVSDKLNVFVEKKGRGGKTATIIIGFTCGDDELRRIASELKNRLGCGGSCRDGEILVQGNRRDEVASILRDMGYKI